MYKYFENANIYVLFFCWRVEDILCLSVLEHIEKNCNFCI